MWMLFWAWPVLAANLVFDAKVPAEIRMDGGLVGEIAVPAEIRVTVPPGIHELTVLIGGDPVNASVEVPEEGAALVLIGKTGVTTGSVPVEPATESTEGVIELRSASTEALLLVLDKTRRFVMPGETASFVLPIGDHALTLKNRDGTVVWAHGTLRVSGPSLILQLSEGRMPEVSGGGGTYVPGGK